LDSTLISSASPLSDSWRRRVGQALANPAAQQPEWPDGDRVRSVCRALARAPVLADAAETDRLAAELAPVARGEALLLQGGDCAETFAQNTESHVRGNIATLWQMAEALAGGTGRPVVKVARIAGQFAKPRSSVTDALGLPVYRGDIVNSPVPTPMARIPEPERMASAYRNSAAALDIICDLSWLDDIAYTCHEMLLLDYEQALLRCYRRAMEQRVYSTSSHFLWIGERTRQIGGAHIALARLLANPIGIKIGPSVTPGEAVRYAELLNPVGAPGRLTIICRLGCENVRRLLPGIVTAVTAAGHRPIWLCDPMHGNTTESVSGYKTRDFRQIADEVTGFMEVHRMLGTHPGGIHVEMTGDAVTECLGGWQEICDADLAARYETGCDPRLNRHQALELTALTARLYESL
jgi:3-deoxy-D-arabino-heptulosonate 7-phosphate (DAHP) synthase class II